jgi:microcystin-dependent protein
MTLYKWSQTASSDATADSTINWAEGQAPSSVNDSARAMMAATAKYRDDIAGAIVTGGTSTAYTVSSYEVFDTPAHLNGQMIAFAPHATNGATVTLNVDSLGAKPLRSAPGVELLAGTIIQGTPYVAVYNNSDSAFYLQGFFGNPYNIPLGGGLPFIGSTAPNSSFVFPYGQAISRTTYAALYSLVSTTYGTGDGSTTFNIPDFCGRVIAGLDGMGGSAANRLTTASGMTGLSLGATGGAEAHTLTLGELPTGLTSANASQSIVVASISTGIPSNVVGFSGQRTDGTGTGIIGPSGGTAAVVVGGITSTGINSIGVTSNNTSGSAHSIIQPTIAINYILRIV